MYKIDNIVYIDTDDDLYNWLEGTIDDEFKGTQEQPVVFSILNGIYLATSSILHYFPRIAYSNNPQETLALKYNYYYTAIIGRGNGLTNINLSPDDLSSITTINNIAYCSVIPPSCYLGEILIKGLNWNIASTFDIYSNNISNYYYVIHLFCIYSNLQSFNYIYNNIESNYIRVASSSTNIRLYFEAFHATILQSKIDASNFIPSRLYVNQFTLFNGNLLITRSYVETRRMYFNNNLNCLFEITTGNSVINIENFGLNIYQGIYLVVAEYNYGGALFGTSTNIKKSYIGIQSLHFASSTGSLFYFWLDSTTTENFFVTSQNNSQDLWSDMPSSIVATWSQIQDRTWLENQMWDFNIVWDMKLLTPRMPYILVRLLKFNIYKKNNNILQLQNIVYKNMSGTLENKDLGVKISN